MSVPADLSSAHGLHTWEADEFSDNEDRTGILVFVESWQFAVEVWTMLWLDRFEDRRREPDEHYYPLGWRKS